MGLKKQLSDLCALKPEQILLAEVHNSNIKVVIHSLLFTDRGIKNHWLLEINWHVNNELDSYKL